MIHALRRPPRAPLSAADELGAPQRERPADAHRQELETDDGEVRAGPAPVGLGVLLPQHRERAGAVRGAEHAVAGGGAEEVDAGGEEPAGAEGRGVGRGVDEEAVPEEGALEDEVDERVERVPDEEHARLRSALRREHAPRERVRRPQCGDCPEEGEDGRLVDLQRRGWACGHPRALDDA